MPEHKSFMLQQLSEIHPITPAVQGLMYFPNAGSIRLSKCEFPHQGDDYFGCIKFLYCCQIAQVVQLMLFKWARQLGQPKQQQRNTASISKASLWVLERLNGNDTLVWRTRKREVFFGGIFASCYHRHTTFP